MILFTVLGCVIRQAFYVWIAAMLSPLSDWGWRLYLWADGACLRCLAKSDAAHDQFKNIKAGAEQ